MRANERVELARVCVVTSCKTLWVEEGEPPPVIL